VAAVARLCVRRGSRAQRPGDGQGEDPLEVLLGPVGPHVPGVMIQGAREFEALDGPRHQVQ
jgi:hypothetical protein